MTLDCKKVSLKKGSTGSEVKELQQILKDKKYYTGKIDGDFGSMTEEAVKKLQKAQGNTQDGWFGEKTCTKLNQKKTTTTTSKSKTPISDRIQKFGGVKIKGHRSLFENFRKGRYSGYMNDIYTLEEELNRLEQRLPLNCVDYGQLYYKAYKEQMAENGWTDEIVIVRGTVTCSSGKSFGHIWCRVKEDGRWINVDPSAVAAHGYSYGNLICTRGYTITNVNPDWLLTDDGIT